MKVIVGSPDKKTPVFSRDIEWLEINPWWNVPAGIAANELMPKIQDDPTYATKRGYQLIEGHNDDVVIRQRPGPGNTLGRLKFIFPNRFNVYMHDTSGRYLFARSYRALSHGCVRVEKPLELALFLLQDDPEWTREKIEAAIAKGAWKVVPVESPCRVHTIYMTAWVSEAGEINFRPDIYRVDRPLWAALHLPGDRDRPQLLGEHMVRPGGCGRLVAGNPGPEGKPLIP